MSKYFNDIGLTKTHPPPANNVKDDLDTAFKHLSGLSETSHTSQAITERLFYKSLPLIRSILKRYEQLDVVNDRDDFFNQAYLAVHDAVNSYRPDSGAKFSSILTWLIQKQFEKICPSSHKQVEVTKHDGSTETISYKKFQKIKNQLMAEGAEWKISSRYTQLDINATDLPTDPDDLGDGLKIRRKLPHD
jgi:hypothetical protein